MNILNALGIRVDNDLPPDVNNPRGYFETEEILELNEEVLELAGVNWHTVFSNSLHGRWQQNSALDAVRQRLADHIAEKANRSPELWAIKEPRVSLLLPLYEQIFEQCNLSPIYVLCIRDPRAVALSLKRRDNFPAILSELLWLDYTMNAMRIAGDRIKAVVHYEKWFQDGRRRQILTLAAAIGQAAAGDQLLSLPFERIVDSSLNHSGIKNGALETGSFAIHSVGEIYRLILAQDYAGAMKEYLEVERGLAWGTHRSSWCQVFWRMKGEDGFEEANSGSVRTLICQQRQTVRVAIPALSQPLAGIRADLSSVPGHVNLFALRLTTSQGGTLWEWDGELDTLLKFRFQDMTPLGKSNAGGVLIRFDTSDPGLILPLAEGLYSLAGGGAVEIELEWLAETANALALGAFAQELETRAKETTRLQEALAEQTRQVDTLRKRAERNDEWRRKMLQSWSWRLTAPIRWLAGFFTRGIFK
jgi:hypothetical protein